MGNDERRPGEMSGLSVSVPVLVLVGGERDDGEICDPRTYCIHKTLFDISHNGKTDDNLLFAGHQVYRFGQDPLYANGHIPTTHELIEAIKAGR